MSLPDDIADPPMFYDQANRPIGLRTWCRLFEDTQGRIVAQTNVDLPGGGKAWVSTVWMGIDMNLPCSPPLIFETGLFWEAGNLSTDDSVMRYTTRDQAVAGHDQMVAYAYNLGQVPVETRESLDDE